jgi:hypothetical protein
MTLPDDWEDHFKRLYERTYEVLIIAGCDEAQARAIARERVVHTAQQMIAPGDNPDVVVIL